MKRFVPAILTLLLLAPVAAYAHGFIADGHDGSLRVLDYIELGAITLGSLGLIIYSYRQTRGSKKK